MKKAEKKMLLSHMKKDDKEFRSQIKDDTELKKKILGKKKKMKIKKEREEKNEKYEKKGK